MPVPFPVSGDAHRTFAGAVDAGRIVIKVFYDRSYRNAPPRRPPHLIS